MLLMWFVVSTDGQKPNVGNMKLFHVHINNNISCTACSLRKSAVSMVLLRSFRRAMPRAFPAPVNLCTAAHLAQSAELKRESVWTGHLARHIRFLHVDIQIQVHRAYKLIATAARTSAH